MRPALENELPRGATVKEILTVQDMPSKKRNPIYKKLVEVAGGN
jgi:hypothetical protein